MYIKNIKCSHLTPVFQLRNINLEFSTCPHKFKWLLCTEKPDLKFLMYNLDNHMICFEEL